MKFEKVNVRAIGNGDISSQLAMALNQVNGVLDVETIDSTGECRILYDDKLVTFAEVKAAISRSSALIELPRHGVNGVCCGSCGGE